MKRGEKYAHFWIEEGILNFVYKPNAVIDLEAAKAVVKARIRFQNEISYPILCDIRQLKSASKAAREYLAESGCLKALAVAIVMESAYSGTLYKAYVNISNPSVPTQGFNTISEALNFLNQFK
ncbi:MULTISPECIES: DUF7793 family protein [Psychroflexus]|jgi:hypothetical protein|uniref:DUF7793 family protein n=1 Tax=Psychroflexus TaxID=83612 RepID=UPI000367EBD3|nr:MULTISPECIES: hypothetical protein [Psychroflexus]MBZ9650872.1 hypothetical protein [Psychroflexus montanilacus]